MFSDTMSKALYYSFEISRHFGGSPLVFYPKTEQFSVHHSTMRKVNRNFTLASLWYILAFLIVLKRFQNTNNLDQFYLTLAWWIGYTLALGVYSISKFHSPETCNTGSGATNLVRQIYGNKIISYDLNL